MATSWQSHPGGLRKSSEKKMTSNVVICFASLMIWHMNDTVILQLTPVTRWQLGWWHLALARGGDNESVVHTGMIKPDRRDRGSEGCRFCRWLFPQNGSMLVFYMFSLHIQHWIPQILDHLWCSAMCKSQELLSYWFCLCTCKFRFYMFTPITIGFARISAMDDDSNWWWIKFQQL